jgi:hypothetical protein
MEQHLGLRPSSMTDDHAGSAVMEMQQNFSQVRKQLLAALR